MLHHSTDRIAECLQLADEADHRASTASVETTRKDYELLARSWRRLALSYELSAHLERFIQARSSTLPTHQDTAHARIPPAKPYLQLSR
ncbi:MULTISPECIES: hypothetical protein [Bradyrhizobium]|uniref:Uncharacterized protein n=1 Tax=Bradyrhizobium elkanii TaxID=29448 RepID=A0ABV4F150_BRAEL|nr:hypothetical protein [Bradyrhizobium elkanii]MBP2426585.1 hypothetical protein [Bradyrhizobium elkanii]MCP1758170.1 hypothetical protein [Bradyrhizobium elkanii]MCP1969730.1 hypothetical protein [Bradyrhizobium elkanii]MCP1983487.1 hypothetical protein [Bradyrhizobium elkanii]MCS3691846.1 hypothetical protein [Bradyrhizobium elkanii]